ncbi:MAG TPA: TetR/AcrR family transcriptional regulator [Acidimicrobiales bacterium]|nr:TetR/AcrR family transcriptional regulator [Acidimicrobiales bacterium]
MSEARRSRTPSAEMGDALLDAADDVLEKEGPDALSVRRIATVAGVAPMGVYNHFDSKFGIVDALFIRGFQRLEAAMGNLEGIADPLEALREGGRRYRALALAHPMMYQVMFLRAVAGFEPSDRAMEVATQAFERLVSTVRRAAGAGLIEAASPTLTAQVIWSSLHGWMSLEISEVGFVEDQSAGFTLLCSTILRGLRP